MTYTKSYITKLKKMHRDRHCEGMKCISCPLQGRCVGIGTKYYVTGNEKLNDSHIELITDMLIDADIEAVLAEDK